MKIRAVKVEVSIDMIPEFFIQGTTHRKCAVIEGILEGSKLFAIDHSDMYLGKIKLIFEHPDYIESEIEDINLQPIVIKIDSLVVMPNDK